MHSIKTYFVIISLILFTGVVAVDESPGDVHYLKSVLVDLDMRTILKIHEKSIGKTFELESHEKGGKFSVYIDNLPVSEAPAFFESVLISSGFTLTEKGTYPSSNSGSVDGVPAGDAGNGKFDFNALKQMISDHNTKRFHDKSKVHSMKTKSGGMDLKRFIMRMHSITGINLVTVNSECVRGSVAGTVPTPHSLIEAIAIFKSVLENHGIKLIIKENYMMLKPGPECER